MGVGVVGQARGRRTGCGGRYPVGRSQLPTAKTVMLRRFASTARSSASASAGSPLPWNVRATCGRVRDPSPSRQPARRHAASARRLVSRGGRLARCLSPARSRPSRRRQLRKCRAALLRAACTAAPHPARASGRQDGAPARAARGVRCVTLVVSRSCLRKPVRHEATPESLIRFHNATSDLALALELADAADVLTLSRFQALDLSVDTKPDTTPVSDADLATEALIRERLAAARPDDAVLGEEQGDIGTGARRWILDPIDGTKNYIRGVPVWATLAGPRGRRRDRGGRGERSGARTAVVGQSRRRRLRQQRDGTRTPPGVSRSARWRPSTTRRLRLLLAGRLGERRPAGGLSSRSTRTAWRNRASATSGRTAWWPKERSTSQRRARGLAVGHRAAEGHRRGGRRHVHRPGRRPAARTREASCARTAAARRRCSTC